MSSAALTALRNAILTNTLDAGQQGALATALAVIIPDFPTVDELANAVPENDEVLAREWIAALYTIQAGDASPMPTLQRVISPTEITELPAPFQPGTLGKILFVADITPEVSGLVLLSFGLNLISDATGVPGVAIFIVPLQSIAGGTVLAPGLTVEPTGTTPAFGTGIPAWATAEPTFDPGDGSHAAILTVAGLPINGTVGQRLGIIGVAKDTGAQNWTALNIGLSAVEQPLE
jgi:hypothetical protein